MVVKSTAASTSQCAFKKVFQVVVRLRWGAGSMPCSLRILPSEKEKADAAACDAINGVFDLVDIAGEVGIGEGAKDKAPGLFLGDKLGTWKRGAPRFDGAVDPIDGTTKLANGLPHSPSLMAGRPHRT